MKVYSITDIDSYAKEMRQAAASTISDNTNDNLDDFISIDQIRNMIHSQCIGFDSNDRPMLNEDINETIYESIVIWIHNIGLAKLAGQNLLECAWDSDLNEMIFWSNKETNHNEQPIKRRNKKKNK